MAKLRGTGIAAVGYPTGMNLGGDPSQALIHATTTGTFVIHLSSADLGQGLKTVLAQIGAEALGVPFENVMINAADTDSVGRCRCRRPSARSTSPATGKAASTR